MLNSIQLNTIKKWRNFQTHCPISRFPFPFSKQFNSMEFCKFSFEINISHSKLKTRIHSYSNLRFFMFEIFVRCPNNQFIL